MLDGLADNVLEYVDEGVDDGVELGVDEGEALGADGLALKDDDSDAVELGEALSADGLAEIELETLAVLDELAEIDGLELADLDADSVAEADALFEIDGVRDLDADGDALIETLAASDRITGGVPPTPLRTSAITASSVSSDLLNVLTWLST